jgi:hypothetical protein
MIRKEALQDIQYGLLSEPFLPEKLVVTLDTIIMHAHKADDLYEAITGITGEINARAHYEIFSTTTQYDRLGKSTHVYHLLHCRLEPLLLARSRHLRMGGSLLQRLLQRFDEAQDVQRVPERLRAEYYLRLREFDPAQYDAVFAEDASGTRTLAKRVL